MGTFYTNYLNNLAKTPKESWKDDYQALTDMAFSNTSDIYTIGEELTFGTQIYTDVETRVVHIITSNTSVRSSEDYKKFIFQDNDKLLKMGNRFTFNGYTWLGVEYDKYKYESNAIIARRCNHLLKWYNKEGKLIQEPCVVDYFKYSKTAGSDESKYMILPENQRLLVLQQNQFSEPLDYGKRFIFNKMAWRILDYDRVNDDGLLYMTVEKCGINNDKDDLVNEIAYNKYPADVYTIDILDSLVEVASASTYQLQIETAINGILNTDVEVTYSSSDDSIATVSDSGLVTGVANGTIIITAELTNNDAISDVVSVEVKASPADNIVEEIEGNDEIPERLTATYEIYKYINGVAQADTYTFGISGSYTSTVSSDGNNITIKALDDSSGNTVILTATNNITSDVITKNIDLINLW